MPLVTIALIECDEPRFSTRRVPEGRGRSHGVEEFRVCPHEGAPRVIIREDLFERLHLRMHKL